MKLLYTKSIFILKPQVNFILFQDKNRFCKREKIITLKLTCDPFRDEIRERFPDEYIILCCTLVYTLLSIRKLITVSMEIERFIKSLIVSYQNFTPKAI